MNFQEKGISYKPEMRESIKRVEATRPTRLGEPFPMMEPEEKKRLLEKFHPDYLPECFPEIKVGPNKGEKAMNELTDILEGSSRATPDMLDLEQIDYKRKPLIFLPDRSDSVVMDSLARGNEVRPVGMYFVF